MQKYIYYSLKHCFNTYFIIVLFTKQMKTWHIFKIILICKPIHTLYKAIKIKLIRKMTKKRLIFLLKFIDFLGNNCIFALNAYMKVT